METTEVIIVGAGPVGLSLAFDCAQRGVAFRIFDAAPALAPRPRGLLLWSATQEIFSALGLLGKIRQASQSALRGLCVCSPHRTLMDIDFSAEIDSPFPEPLIIPQDRIEAILHTELTALGHRIEYGMEFASLVQDTQSVTANFLNNGKSGERLEVSAKYLVGCDGMQSSVRYAIGATFHKSPPSECFIFCDARVRGMEAVPQVLHIFTSSAGPLTMVPIHGDRWRIVSSRGEGAGTALPILAEMQEHIDERCGPRGITIETADWFFCSRTIERTIEGFRAGRVVLAGDAAHIHHLASGQGLNVGIGDSFNLGWKLDAILHGGDDAETLLSSYASERADIAERIIAKTEKLTNLVFLSRYPFGGFPEFFGALVGARTPESMIANVLSGIDARYKRPSPLLATEDLWHEDWRDYGFAVGKKMRNATLPFADKSITLFAALPAARTGIFLLFSGRTPRPSDALAVAAYAQEIEKLFPKTQIFKVWQGVMPPTPDWATDASGFLHKRFGVDFPAVYFVRPDGIVAARSQPLAPEMLHLAPFPSISNFQTKSLA